MDLSKLPKLSKTAESRPVPEATEPAPPPPIQVVRIPPAIGLPEAWISIGLGVLLLFLFPRVLIYMHSPASIDQKNPFQDEQGNVVPYIKTVDFWNDLGVTVFAVALIVEGIVLAAARKTAPLLFAFCLTTLAAVFNVGVITHTYPFGFPIFCGIAIVVLGYMALTQWRLIAMLRQ